MSLNLESSKGGTSINRHGYNFTTNLHRLHFTVIRLRVVYWVTNEFTTILIHARVQWLPWHHYKYILIQYGKSYKKINDGHMVHGFYLR